jgi:anti-anti-sigma regulatory factor
MRTQAAKRTRNRTDRDPVTAERSVLRVALEDADAVALKRRLESALKQGRYIEIDASALAGLTTAGVQVLLAAAADAEARHVQFRLIGGGPLIVDAFGELGLADKVASWLDPAGSLAGRVAET